VTEGVREFEGVIEGESETVGVKETVGEKLPVTVGVTEGLGDPPGDFVADGVTERVPLGVGE
jgi:hypothetical protein